MRGLITGIEKGVAKNGNGFLKVSVVLETKEKKLFYAWDGIDAILGWVEAGEHVFDIEFTDDPSFPKIVGISPCAGNPVEFYDYVYPDDQYAEKLLESLVGQIGDQFLEKLVDAVLSMPGPSGFADVKSAFIVIPAAKAYHHDYRYGLLRHTHEVMSFVSRVCSSDMFAKTLSRPVALCAALLHDVGKCFEYSFDGFNSADYGVSSDVNQIYLGSHLYKGGELIAVAFDRMDKSMRTQENALKLEHVKHAVLSHHLQRDWASVPKQPQTLEAYLVFLGDYFSAAFGKFNAIDWSSVSPENLLGSTSKFDTFFGFTPLLQKIGESGRD